MEVSLEPRIIIEVYELIDIAQTIILKYSSLKRSMRLYRFVLHGAERSYVEVNG